MWRFEPMPSAEAAPAPDFSHQMFAIIPICPTAVTSRIFEGFFSPSQRRQHFIIVSAD